MSFDKLLHDIYYNKHNYDGINQLYSKALPSAPDIKKTDVKKWLDKQNAYQQTAPAKVGAKEYLPIYSEAPYSFQMDLTFFPRYASRNSGYTVLFTAINVNTRYAYAYKAKSKDMKTITGFLKDMERQTKIKSITCDEGLEFNNKEFKDFCNNNNITLYFVKGDSHKLGVINRFHRTIKEKLTKHFIATESKRWIDVIDDIIRNYNHSVNRGIGFAPADVTNGIEVDIINEKREQSREIRANIPDKVDVGDFVRLLSNKNQFEDKLKPKYGAELHQVVKSFNNAVDIKKEDGDIVRKKLSQIRKVRQGGEVLPTKQTIDKPEKQTNRILKEILDKPTPDQTKQPNTTAPIASRTRSKKSI